MDRKLSEVLDVQGLAYAMKVYYDSGALHFFVLITLNMEKAIDYQTVKIK